MTDRQTAVRLRAKLRQFLGSLSEDERVLFGIVLDGASDAEQVLAEWGASIQALERELQAQPQEMNESFNVQYLGLQQKLQNENRRFSMVSNILKTKHDTAKNSISNIR